MSGDAGSNGLFLLQKVGLKGFGDRSPHHLSGGEKQRVCLAGILACNPDVLALDEPTNNLDPRGRRELKVLLMSIPATKIIASHDLELIVALCSRTVIMDAGLIVAEGPTIDLLSNEQLMIDHGLEKPHSLQHRHPHGSFLQPPLLYIPRDSPPDSLLDADLLFVPEVPFGFPRITCPVVLDHVPRFFQIYKRRL